MASLGHHHHYHHHHHHHYHHHHHHHHHYRFIKELPIAMMCVGHIWSWDQTQAQNKVGYITCTSWYPWVCVNLASSDNVLHLQAVWWTRAWCQQRRCRNMESTSAVPHSTHLTTHTRHVYGHMRAGHVPWNRSQTNWVRQAFTILVSHCEDRTAVTVQEQLQ